MAVLSETKGTQWSLIAYEMLYDKSRNLLASRFDINEFLFELEKSGSSMNWKLSNRIEGIIVLVEYTC